MLRRFRPDTLRAVLLASLLIVAQLLLVQHQTDLAQHAAGDHCEWCLTHSPLTGALPGTGLALPERPAASTPAAADYSFVARSVPSFYASRAPPFSPRS